MFQGRHALTGRVRRLGCASLCNTVAVTPAVATVRAVLRGELAASAGYSRAKALTLDEDAAPVRHAGASASERLDTIRYS